MAKLYEESDTKRNDRTAHGDDDDDENIAAGPELPLDYEAGESDDEEGRFFGGGITVETAGALDFIDERDQIDPLVRSRKVQVETGHAKSGLSEARKYQSSLATETCSPIREENFKECGTQSKIRGCSGEVCPHKVLGLEYY